MTKLRTILENIEYHWSQPHYNIFKSLYINFRCLPFNIARKLPIAIYGKCDFYWLKGKIRINGPITKKMIKLGQNNEFMTGFSHSAFILLGKDSVLTFNGPCKFANDYHIRLGNNAQLNIGAYTFFGGNIRIISTTNIKIGDYSRIAYDSQLVDSNFHFVYNSIKHQTAPFYKEIIIGEYNWIGNKTSIMKGVKTKPHTIVASSSLLNKDYTKEEGDYPTLGGSPAEQLTHGLRRLFSHKHEALLLDFFHKNPQAAYYEGIFDINSDKEISNEF